MTLCFAALMPQSPQLKLPPADGLESCFVKGGRSVSILDDNRAKPHLRGTHRGLCPDSLRPGDPASLWAPAQGPKLDGGQALKGKTPCSECGENVNEYFLPRKDTVSPEGEIGLPGSAKTGPNDRCWCCRLAGPTSAL